MSKPASDTVNWNGATLARLDAQALGGGRPERHVSAPLRRFAADTEGLEQPREVGFIERAGHADEIAEVFRDAVAVAREPVRRGGVLPAPGGEEPPRRGEVVVGDHRRQPVVVARLEHPPVVVQFRDGEVSFLRFDARPLQREAVGGEPERGDQRDVLAVAVVVVDGVSGGLGEDRAGEVLEEPRVAVGVVALHLVGGVATPQRKVVGEVLGIGHG